MRVVAHLDPIVLERALLSAVDRAHPRDAVGRTLIVVPTLRLADHLERRLTEYRPAWVGLEVLHLAALPGKILEESGRPIPKILPKRVARVIAQRELEKDRGNPWRRRVKERPGSMRPLMAALTDLREAGIEVDDLRACVDDPEARGIASLYASYIAALQHLEGESVVDEAGLTRLALGPAAGFASPRQAIFVHGAYEWIGVGLDLIRELDRGSPIVAFVPVAPGSRASTFAERFASRHLLAEDAALEPLESPEEIPPRPALECIYAEEARPRPIPDHFAFRHTQGAAAEVRIAVRNALAAIGRGAPPEEIAIVARSLEPYGPAIEEVLAADPLPHTSSLQGPLRRQPVAHDFLLLLEVLDEDFPRRSTAELLRSPRIDWSSFHEGGELPPGDLADVWSRRSCLIGGLSEWTDDLPRWAGRSAVRHGEQARRFGELLASLAQTVRPETARGWAEHGEMLVSLIDRMFGAPEDATAKVALDALRVLVEEMGRLAEFTGDRRDVPFSEVRGWLEQGVGDSRLAVAGKDTGGVRILDAMQLRGLTFRHVSVLGMNSNVFPHPAREDPVLPDELRGRIVERTGRPLPIKARSGTEERQLLAAMLGAARTRVEVSWQRADDSGRARTPSLALREIARLALGAPDLSGLKDGARHLPSHPGQWLRALLEAPGLISDSEALLYLGLVSTSEDDRTEMGRLAPRLSPGLRMLRATQSFGGVEAAYDARVGGHDEEVDFSVSALERLGRCPLRYFFYDVLRVGELDEPAGLMEIARGELGSRVHEVLERLYARLLSADRLDDPEAAAALLGEEADGVLGPVGARLARRVPLLGQLVEERWSAALGAFVRGDVRRMAAGGERLRGLEQPHAARIELDSGAMLTLHGRVDRVAEKDGRSIVADYKTSGALKRRANPTGMLKGHELQVPLYRLLAGEVERVDLLGVGPSFAGDDSIASFSGFPNERVDRGFRETLEVLHELSRTGSYPFRDSEDCKWCAYKEACRRNHPPSKAREENAADTRRFRGLQKKNAGKSPLLADLQTEESPS